MTKHHQHTKPSCRMFLLALQKTLESAKSLRKCVSIYVIVIIVVHRHFLYNKMPWLVGLSAYKFALPSFKP